MAVSPWTVLNLSRLPASAEDEQTALERAKADPRLVVEPYAETGKSGSSRTTMARPGVMSPEQISELSRSMQLYLNGDPEKGIAANEDYQYLKKKMAEQEAAYSEINNRPVQTDYAPIMNAIDYFTHGKTNLGKTYKSPMNADDRAILKAKLLGQLEESASHVAGYRKGVEGQFISNNGYTTVTENKIEDKSGLKAVVPPAPKANTAADKEAKETRLQRDKFRKVTEMIPAITQTDKEVKNLFAGLKANEAKESTTDKAITGAGRMARQVIGNDLGLLSDKERRYKQIQDRIGTIIGYLRSGKVMNKDEVAKIENTFGSRNFSTLEDAQKGYNDFMKEVQSIVQGAEFAFPKAAAEARQKDKNGKSKFVNSDDLKDLGLPESPGKLKVGDVLDGHRYKGGEPSNPESWEKL